jgi:hypothetical protein
MKVASQCIVNGRLKKEEKKKEETRERENQTRTLLIPRDASVFDRHSYFVNIVEFYAKQI